VRWGIAVQVGDSPIEAGIPRRHFRLLFSCGLVLLVSGIRAATYAGLQSAAGRNYVIAICLSLSIVDFKRVRIW
jgi:hypothetical protein